MLCGTISCFVAAGLLTAIAFLFGCTELSDPDFWWHARSGQWICENGRPPDLDPFSYGSADQRWIDLHWLFQVGLACTYSWAGSTGVVTLCATLAGLSVLAGLAARVNTHNFTTALLCCVPGVVVMSLRFSTRPEMTTLLFTAVFLAVLVRINQRPRLIWVLPAAQLVWVNTHGLFVFGPILLGFWWADLAARSVWRRVWPAAGLWEMQADRRTLLRLGAATALVLLACLANPYGLQGTTFPFVLYPKVSEAGNPYKEYIDEFQTTSWQFHQKSRSGLLIGHDIGLEHRLATHFLLLTLPISFLLPTAWRVSRIGGSAFPPPRLAVWVSGLAGSLALAGLNAWSAATGLQNPVSVVIADAIPWVMGGGWFVAGLHFLRRKNPCWRVWWAGGAALALWTWWLKGYFSTPESAGISLGWEGGLLLVVGPYLVAQFLRTGGSLFALLLATAFSYLGLSACNSLSRFGLVAAVVVGWNLGGCVTELTAFVPSSRGLIWARVATRLGLTAGLTAWLVAMLAGVPGVPGRLAHTAFSEPPLLNPHEAAKFAGQEGMPPHVSGYPLRTANTFVFHNAPSKKVYMDARLEVPRLGTFLKYRAIHTHLLSGDPRWAEEVSAIGNPALILDHERLSQGEAAVLTHPGWRMVYFDALASVFVPHEGQPHDGRFPKVSLAARHFANRHDPSVPHTPGAAEKEMIALANLATALCRYPDAAWSDRIPAVLGVFERSAVAIGEDGGDPATVWMLVGTSCWALRPDVRTPPSSAENGWVTHADIRWAQLSYGLRRAHTLKPKESRFTGELYRLFKGRRMIDAQRSIGLEMLASGVLDEEEAAAVRSHVKSVPPAEDFGKVTPDGSADKFLRLFRTGRTEDATRLAEEKGNGVWAEWDWETVDRLAEAWLQLGYPDRARDVVTRAVKVPSDAIRWERVGASFWAERNLDEAASAYQKAVRADPQLGIAYWALAWIHTERGRAREAMDAIRRSADVTIPDPLRQELKRLDEFLGSYAPAGRR